MEEGGRESGREGGRNMKGLNIEHIVCHLTGNKIIHLLTSVEYTVCHVTGNTCALVHCSSQVPI